MPQQDGLADAAALKAAQRRRVRAARAARTPDVLLHASAALTEAVLALPELDRCARVALTMATATEPPTDGILTALLARGTTVLAPCIEPAGRMGWVAVDASTDWTVNAHGIREPVGPRGPLDADLVLVPALAVTRDGRRLGQGGGYFDRALADSEAATVALVFDDEVLDDLPSEPHDRAVDVIVTPTRTLRVS